jgi:sugar lactone lactonase YvrE
MLLTEADKPIINQWCVTPPDASGQVQCRANPNGCIVSVDTDMSVHKMVEDVCISRHCLTADKTMYYIDSVRNAYAYDYDNRQATSAIAASSSKCQR